MKQYVALARVSSREQEREGFSLEVQEEALQRYATTHEGVIVKLFKIAETASKQDERKSFKELVSFAKKNAGVLDGILFYKVDRAARNLFDYVELERLESEYDVQFISVSQPTENTPAGRMMRRTMANMASFTTEQQSVDVREGLARRIQEGWFVGKAPYGYRNIRRNGRGVVEIDPETGPVVRRIFHLYAYERLTLDALADRLTKEGLIYRKTLQRFPRSSLHNMLQDRAYMGEIEFKGDWHPGQHEPLIDLGTWQRVQTLLGGAVYQSHSMTYASERIVCGHCGHPITGERKTKRSKSGERQYVYYRCTYYNKGDHPRIRVTESELDRQVSEILGRIKIEDPAVCEWFRTILVSQTKDSQQDSQEQRVEVQRQISMTQTQQDKLVALRINDDVDQELFTRKQTELRERLTNLKLQLESLDRSREEVGDLAVKVFELSQKLTDKWLTADYAAKRRILEIVFLNCRLDGATLCPEIRKPFDVLIKGLSVPLSRADRI